jgi:hypothetical protein
MQTSFLRSLAFCVLIGEVLSGQIPSLSSPAPDGNTAVDQMNAEYIRVWRTIMSPKNVADAFGRRIAQRYIAMQVIIANRSKDYQWLIQEASMDLGNLLGQQKGRQAECQENAALFLLASAQLPDSKISSADLAVLRGVAEKGQALDPRNLTLRSLTGAGVVAAGLIAVANLGLSYSSAVAAFNGPLLAAFQQVFPDYTLEQMNRLSDSAFAANTIVGKQQAKVLVMFIPQPYLLTKKQQKAYYKDPESVYSCADLRLLDANVSGNFIAGVTAAPAGGSSPISISSSSQNR